MRNLVVALAMLATIGALTAAPSVAAASGIDGVAGEQSVLTPAALGHGTPAQGFYPGLIGTGLPTGNFWATGTGGCGAFGYGFCPRFNGSYINTFPFAQFSNGFGGFGGFSPWAFGGLGFGGGFGFGGFPAVNIGIGIP